MLDQNARSAERAAGAQSMEQLVALQSEVAGRQLQSLGDFWTSVWNTAAESQRSFFERVRSEGGEAVRQTYDSAARITEDMTRAAREGAQAARQQERKDRKSA
jgi:YD repeat-containing protein